MNALTGEALQEARIKAQADVRALRARCEKPDQDAIDMILGEARSHYAWQDKPVPVELLHHIYEITASGPTSMNT